MRELSEQEVIRREKLEEIKKSFQQEQTAKNNLLQAGLIDYIICGGLGR